MLTADEVIARLGLQLLTQEGGYFAQSYRAGATLPAGSAPGQAGPRPLATAIYYLLTPGSHSALHRLPGDELYHFYLGDPVELLLLGPAGEARTVTLGIDLAAGQRPQALAPGGWWQGSRLAPGGRLALLGTTMAPGYDADDYEHGHRDRLLADYPAQAALIRTLAT